MPVDAPNPGNFHIDSRPAGYRELSTPDWNGDPNASLEKRMTTNPKQWIAYLESLQSNHQALTNHVDTIGATMVQQYTSMRNYSDAVYEENKNLEGQVEEANQKAAAHAASHIGNSHTRSAKIPDPPMFSGDDRTKTNPFLYLVKGKIEGNLDHFTATTEIQVQFNLVRYVYSRLEGTASRQAFSLVNHHTFVHVNDFLDWISRTFGDPDPVTTAQQKIKNCKQRNRPYMEYLSEFQMHIHETGYDRVAQKAAFYDGLAVEIKNYLVTMSWRDWDLATLQDECARLANAWVAIQAATPKSKATASTTPRSSPAPASGVSTTTTITSAPSPVATGDAMDLSANRVRRGPLTAAEKQARRDRGECLYCGGTGHFATNCPNKPSIRTVSFGSNPPTSPSPASTGTPHPARQIEGKKE